jgi:hypothetical protein
LLLVAWKAPAEGLGNEAISVASEMQNLGSRVSPVSALIAALDQTT